jgi:hypothetical protein
MARVKDAASNGLALLGAAMFPNPISLTGTDGCVGIAVSGEGVKDR